jgi:hypothetical protein
MLLVNRDQRRDAGYSAFVDRIVRHMNLHYWQEFGHLPPDILRGRVRHCIKMGREKGFTFERSLAVFTANMMRIDPRFHEHPSIAALLADIERPEEERLEGFVSDISRRHWAEAGVICGDKKAYWYQVDREMADPGGEE